MLEAAVFVGIPILFFLLGLYLWRFRRVTVTSVDLVLSPENLGELDARANIPNDLTRVPFPTPSMDKFYQGGEEERAKINGQYVRRATRLSLRIKVLQQRIEVLNKRIAEASANLDLADLRRELGRNEENLAARVDARINNDRGHEHQLMEVDARTKSVVDRYWNANLGARPNSENERLDLDALEPPDPDVWRRDRNASVNGEF